MTTCDPCTPVDICNRCRCIVTVSSRGAWHTDRWLEAGADHTAVPIVICAHCGTLAETVQPGELQDAWQRMTDAAPVKGQVPWL